DAPDDGGWLAEAQEQVEREILRGIVNEEAELGGPLSRITLMPKGVDVEILHQALGMPRGEAGRLLARLKPLSFVKQFTPPAGAERLHGEHVFLHDEMYALLRGVMPNLRLNERTVAHALVMNCYNPRIEELEQEIEQHAPEERLRLRERLQKLQVERLYYLLVQDPRQGYDEYRRLSDQANRRRWVGYGMRLLDEFLRFYNDSGRRKQFQAAGISHEQIIRESVQMWVERFHWWGQYEREISFVHCVLERPDDFFIHPERDVAVLGNIRALWARARAMLYGYEPEVVQEAQAMLERLPLPADCTPAQILARARLATSIGYQVRRGGRLAQAAAQYVEACVAFRQLEDCPDELTMALNNLAIVYAERGQIDLARLVIHEAMRINEGLGTEYSTGLTLVISAAIARMRGNYAQAINYGEEALALFRELDDAHGMMWSYVRIGHAKRRMAKHELEKGRDKKLDDVRQLLEEAGQCAGRALKIAQEAGLESNQPMLLAEQGRTSREMGRLVAQIEGVEKSQVHYHQSERLLREALGLKGWAAVERGDAMQDLAEVLFLVGDLDAAQQCLAEVEALIGSDYRIVPGGQPPPESLPTEYFAPLAKVEMTRGQIAFDQGDSEIGIQHYVLAYVYFMRFSPDALEKYALVEYLYKRLHSLPVERQRVLMELIRMWAAQHNLGVDIGPFMEILESLVGV
ncbi:MAG TPA: tetratricopeptide repeat protein, partial [Chloroflexi bacterium]|nr:tetratricopeptide repeat protein [Chloroflexota bacterium]